MLATAGAAAAQAPVRYEISFPNAAHHEAEVTVVFTDLDPGPLELRMSRTSPGRYALHEFAKNVYDVRVTGVGGREVRVERPNLHQWNVSDHGGEVRVTYTLYGDHADGTYTGIDRSHAHLNMPATFMWARGLRARPIELTVHVPEGSGWKVATQLAPTDDPYRFTAPDLAYFMDSPTEVSDFWEDSWQVQGPDGPETIRIALHHRGTDAEARAYARGARAIVQAEMRVYGTFPRYDHGTYTFLACYLPWADGDGMEHRNSTVLTSTGSLENGPERPPRHRGPRVLPLVEHGADPLRRAGALRLRARRHVARSSGSARASPATTRTCRCGGPASVDDEAFAAAVGRAANAVVNARGRRYLAGRDEHAGALRGRRRLRGRDQPRQHVPLLLHVGRGDRAGARPHAPHPLPGVTLDHLMREMWRRHGSPEIPYTVDDIEAALARVTGDAAFARDFFHRYVRGSDVLRLRGASAAAAGSASPPPRPRAGRLRPVRSRRPRASGASRCAAPRSWARPCTRRASTGGPAPDRWAAGPSAARRPRGGARGGTARAIRSSMAVREQGTDRARHGHVSGRPKAWRRTLDVLRTATRPRRFRAAWKEGIR